MTLARILRIARQRIRSLTRASRLDDELGRELALHFDALVQEKIADGLAPDAAQLEARKELGNVAVIQEQCRDQRRVGWFHDLRQDADYGLRILRKHPGFTAVAVVSLALGIGANSAVLGVMAAVRRDSLPLPHADRLVVIRAVPLENPTQSSGVSASDYLVWKARSRTLDAIELSLTAPRDLLAEENGPPAERTSGQSVTHGFFATLGVQPLLGRAFTETEGQTQAPVVIISYRLWQRRYAGAADILNRQIQIDRASRTVVGVMREDFSYWNPRVEFWTPFHVDPTPAPGAARFFGALARLAPGVTIEQAQRELAAISADLAQERRETNAGWGVRVQPLHDALFGWTKEPLITLEVAVAIVLLIAGANVAALLLARATVRQREIAMRVALGAGRARIVRQLLTESVLLSFAGGALGLLVAWLGIRGLSAMGPPIGSPAIAAAQLDLRVLALTGIFSLFTGIVFGLGPALAASNVTLIQPAGAARATRTAARKEWIPAGSFSAAGAGGHALRTGLVVAQLALALIVLIAFGLLTNSFLRLTGRELNFEPAGVLTFEFRTKVQQRTLGRYRGFGYFEMLAPPSATLSQVLDRLRAIPGAESVAGISFPPLDSLILPIVDVEVEGPQPATKPNREPFRAAYFLVTPDLFETIRTPFVSGRDVSEADTVSRPWVAIVNEAAARRFWPGEDPIGRRLRIDAGPDEQPREVIGMVRNIPTRRGEIEPQPVVYASYLQQPLRYGGPYGTMFGQMTFVLRHRSAPLTLVPAARKAVAEIDSGPIAMIFTAEERLEFGTNRLRYNVLLFGALACTAALLAAVGVYGMLAYAVSQRTHEIGVRKALGASPHRVVLFVARYVAAIVGCGLLIGVAGALALTRLLRSQLWGVAPTDPSTYAAVCVALVAVAVLACVEPLRRAATVDPTVALRSE